MALKNAISSASAELRSFVRVRSVSKGVESCALVMTQEQAIDLATKILAVAGAINADGDILVTGYPEKKMATILRRYGTKAPEPKTKAAKKNRA